MAEDAARELPNLPLEDALRLVHICFERGLRGLTGGGETVALGTLQMAPRDQKISRWRIPMIALVAFMLIIVAIVATGCSGSDDTAAGENTVAAPGATVDGEEYTVPAGPGVQVVEVGNFEAGEFVFRYLFNDFTGKTGERNRIGEMWDELHPGQQALIPRARYIECRKDPSDKRAGVAPKAMTLIQTTYQHPIDLTGIPDKTSTVVTMEVTVEDPPNGKLVTGRETFELVVLDGEWKWVLPEAHVQAFKQGSCPN